MSYRALGADSECSGQPENYRCDARSHCEQGFCTCDSQYGINPATGDCVLPSELCATGTEWSASNKQCVINADISGSGGSRTWIGNVAWVAGGLALGGGVLFLLTHRKGAFS